MKNTILYLKFWGAWHSWKLSLRVCLLWLSFFFLASWLCRLLLGLLQGFKKTRVPAFPYPWAVLSVNGHIRAVTHKATRAWTSKTSEMSLFPRWQPDRGCSSENDSYTLSGHNCSHQFCFNILNTDALTFFLLFFFIEYII